MRLSALLSGARRIGMDASPVIDYVEKHPVTIGILAPLFERFESGSLTACGSALLLTEALGDDPAKTQRRAPWEHYEEVLGRIDLASVTPEIARYAGALRQSYGLRAMDALHVASALVSGCDLFLTTDGNFDRLGGTLTHADGRTLRVVTLEKLPR